MKWQPAPEHVAAQCEGMFQNGGPRVYEWRSDVGFYRPQLGRSIAATIANADDGITVIARRRIGLKFKWMQHTKMKETA